MHYLQEMNIMGVDKTYLDLVGDIKNDLLAAKSNDSARKNIESALREISTKYGVGAANKAIDSYKLETLGFKKL
jgi:cytoplasmic iron level regulating protein YaaA (DUF328/UPF0246 family)